MTQTAPTNAATSVQINTDPASSERPQAVPNGALPDPFYPNGVPLLDLQTALAVLTIEAARDNRKLADTERAGAAKAQDDAQGRKIGKMHELADDNLSGAIIEGAFQGLSAAASVGSACMGFSSAMNEGSAGAAAMRSSKLFDAGGKASTATGTIWSGVAKSAADHDREEMAIADRDIDRAKSTVDGASTDSKRADDDIRDTMNYIRQYVSAKEQLGQASILKG
jgi:hypothetical protein